MIADDNAVGVAFFGTLASEWLSMVAPAFEVRGGKWFRQALE
jgi:hypothetical protein